MKTRGGNAHRSRRREAPSHRSRTQNPCPEDPDMSDPFAPREDSWPLGLVPSLGISVPHRMWALTIHRERYGPPSRSVRLEHAPAPRLKPPHANRVLVGILATGPNFNTNLPALGLP